MLDIASLSEQRAARWPCKLSRMRLSTTAERVAASSLGHAGIPRGQASRSPGIPGQVAVAASPAPRRLAPRPFSARYRAMRARWNAEWWSIAFGGPVGNLLAAALAEVTWITPNRLTMVSFLCKLAAVPLLLSGSRGADVAVIVLFQAHTVLDCMDGSLARYRQQPSAMGAYLDKATDMIGLVGILAALGWRAAQDSQDPRVLLVAMLIASATLLRFYVYWVVMHLEREAKVAAPSVGDRRQDCSSWTLGQRARQYLRSMAKVVQVSEADLYFWFALALALRQERAMIYLVGAAQAVWLVLVLARRTWAVAQIDRRARAAASPQGTTEARATAGATAGAEAGATTRTDLSPGAPRAARADHD